MTPAPILQKKRSNLRKIFRISFLLRLLSLNLSVADDWRLKDVIILLPRAKRAEIFETFALRTRWKLIWGLLGRFDVQKILKPKHKGGPLQKNLKIWPNGGGAMAPLAPHPMDPPVPGIDFIQTHYPFIPTFTDSVECWNCKLILEIVTTFHLANTLNS